MLSGIAKETGLSTLRKKIMVDTSPIDIGWVVIQEDVEGYQNPIQFTAKVLNERQRKYAHSKRELWGILWEINLGDSGLSDRGQCNKRNRLSSDAWDDAVV